MSHWAYDYVAKPWRRGAKGPDAYDCLGLVTTVLHNHFDLELEVPNDYANGGLKLFKSEIARREDWQPVNPPMHGDVCVMARSRLPVHIGIIVMVDGLRCLHSVEGFGVMAQKILDLRFSGWGHLTFYRHSKCS